MKKAIYFILFLGVAALLSGQSTDSSKGQMGDKSNEKKCGMPVEGLRPCVITPAVSVTAGESVIVNLSIENLTDKTFSLGNGPVNSYEITVTDSKGDKVLSFTEQLEKKVDEGKIPVEDLIKSLPVNSSPGPAPLEAKQELKLEFNLSQSYDLKARGKYQVEISRQIVKPDGMGDAKLSFAPIQIQVK